MAMNMATQTDFTGDEGPHGTSILKPAPLPEELAERFPELEIIELLGRGGMGAVYKTRQKELDRIVALKILPPGIGETPGFAERFTREARALAKLNHPNIVTLYEFGRADGLFFFLMEYVDGVNLRQLLEGGRVSAREALAIVPQICDALQYAHDQGLVHRDIKPDNILMDRRGRVKVADFGLAKIVNQTGDPGPAVNTEAGEGTGARGTDQAAPELTEAGKVMGTPRYMAPEQEHTPLAVDHRADIYALGVVFYQMLTGELPGKPIEPPSSKVRIDVRLDEIVLRALEKTPELRYQQASVLKTAVEDLTGTAAPEDKQDLRRESPSESPDGQSRDERRRRAMRRRFPWQIWVAVLMLGLEASGNLLSIPREPIALLWLGVKALLITGLLLKWRPVFVLALLLTGIHIIYFASANPVAAFTNLLLLGLIGSAFRFYFPPVTSDHSAAMDSTRESREASRTSKPVRWAIAVVITLFGIGVIAAAMPFLTNRYLSGVVTDAATGKPIAGASVSIWSPDKSSGFIINRTPRAKADGRLRIFIPRKLITPDFKAIVVVHAAGYDSGSWSFSEVQADSAKGQLNFQLHSSRQESRHSSVVFHPAIVRVVTGAIDFDSGKLMDLPLPPPLGDRDEARYEWFNSKDSGSWMRQHGMDAVHGNHALVSKDLLLVKLEEKDWNTLSAHKLHERIAAKAAGTDSFTDSSGTTFGFKTREGGIGIVQMVEERCAPRTTTLLPGVKLRYKLVRNDPVEPGLAPKSEFSATLPDGSFVELVSIIYGSTPRRPSGQAKNIDFWNPDGTPLTGSIGWSFGPSNLGSRQDPARDYRMFVVRWGGPDKNNPRLMGWQLDDNPQDSADGQFTVTPKGESAENWVGLGQGFPRGKKTADLRFSLASGPYMTGPKPEVSWGSSGSTPYGGYSLGKIFEHNGNAAVTLTHNLKGCDYRLRITVDTDPKPESQLGGLLWEWKQESRREKRYQPVYGRVVGGGAFNQTFEFPGVPAKEAMAKLPSINFEVRPTRQVAFESVALNPGEITRLQVRVEDAAGRSTYPAIEPVITDGFGSNGNRSASASLTTAVERVLNDPDNGSGERNRETLNLRTGEQLSALDEAPKDRGGRLRALLSSKGDLFAEYDNFVAKRWALTTAGLMLSDFPTRQWDKATSADVNEALEEPSALQRVEHSGATLYLLPDGLLPLTLAFKTQTGERGLLQVTALHDNPRAITIRYKLVRNNPAKPKLAPKTGSVPGPVTELTPGLSDLD